LQTVKKVHFCTFSGSRARFLFGLSPNKSGAYALNSRARDACRVL